MTFMTSPLNPPLLTIRRGQRFALKPEHAASATSASGKTHVVHAN